MANKFKSKRDKRIRRHRRVRGKIFGTHQRPRLSVFRSNNNLFAQLIDDSSGRTLASASSFRQKTAVKKGFIAEKRKKEEKGEEVGSKLVVEIGEVIGKKALELGIKEVIFDRGGYKYHGNVKKFAESARKAGLKF